MQGRYPQGSASECIILFRQSYCMSGVVVVDGANWDEELLQGINVTYNIEEVLSQVAV